MDNRKKALIAIILFSIAGGLMAAVTKIGLRDIPSVSFAFIRFFVASLAVTPFLIREKHISFYHIKKLVPISLFATVNIMFFTLGIRFTTAISGQLLYAAVPLLTGIVIMMFFKERLSTEKIIGLIIGLIGVLFIIILPLVQTGSQFSGDIKGNMLISIAVIAWSLYMAFSKKLLKDYSPFTVTSFFILTTAVVLLPLFVIEFNTNSLWLASVSLSAILSILYVIFIGTIGGYFLNQYAIKNGGSVFASMSFYLSPLTTFLSAFLLLGEKLTLGVFIGGALALLGVYIVTKKR